MPFLEKGAEPKLREVIGGALQVKNDLSLVGQRGSWWWW